MIPNIPTQKTKPKYNFKAEKCILVAQNGGGKTTLMANFPWDILFIPTEKGYLKTEIYSVGLVETWDEFIVARQKAIDSKFETICIDTLPALYRMYIQWFCKTNNVKHEGKIAFIGWDLLTRGFAAEMDILMQSSKGMWLLTNEMREDTENGPGKILPNIPYDKKKTIWDSTVGACDFVFYLNHDVAIIDDKPVTTKVIHTVEDDKFMAKARMAFPEPDIPLVMGDPKQSAQRLVNAYNRAANALLNPIKETEKEKTT